MKNFFFLFLPFLIFSTQYFGCSSMSVEDQDILSTDPNKNQSEPSEEINLPETNSPKSNDNKESITPKTDLPLKAIQRPELELIDFTENRNLDQETFDLKGPNESNNFFFFKIKVKAAHGMSATSGNSITITTDDESTDGTYIDYKGFEDNFYTYWVRYPIKFENLGKNINITVVAKDLRKIKTQKTFNLLISHHINHQWQVSSAITNPPEWERIHPVYLNLNQNQWWQERLLSEGQMKEYDINLNFALTFYNNYTKPWIIFGITPPMFSNCYLENVRDFTLTNLTSDDFDHLTIEENFDELEIKKLLKLFDPNENQETLGGLEDSLQNRILAYRSTLCHDHKIQEMGYVKLKKLELLGDPEDIDGIKNFQIEVIRLKFFNSLTGPQSVLSQ